MRALLAALAAVGMLAQMTPMVRAQAPPRVPGLAGPGTSPSAGSPPVCAANASVRPATIADSWEALVPPGVDGQTRTASIPRPPCSLSRRVPRT